MQVTETDIKKAMYILSALPTRDPIDRNLIQIVYLKALEGVTIHSLEIATNNFNSGHSHVDHTFMPSQAELRKECDLVQRKFAEERARKLDPHRQRCENEQQRLRHEATKTPEARARVAAMLARFNQSHDEAKASERQSGITETPDQVRDRLIGQIGETAFNNIPDLPVRDTFKQVGAVR
ncbi:hypothetical protein [Pseudochrobactrum kiredjianiae]|uniref:DUF2280 domain-containing protein n=1 Tax=Pseudochrobactrum kiredjianiae TaxID=386305 RepID=A0ABW3V1B0_9HYPH|nr:hypothetical protein [Pseudochrobactrum kiredjianiae]MDM7852353.1 hypothetical protein [Pseudochrobactrum kiredjianiae]